MGDRLALIATAQEAIIHNCGRIKKKSKVYETAAWGKMDQPSFLNQALLVATSLDAETLLQRLLDFELAMGRQRLEKYGPRLMDIDILLYNEQIIQTPKLQVPHPQMQHRRFVLEPLAEIAPAYIHPVFGITIQQMLENCTDPLNVHKL